jgi:hypothetical protein
MGGCFSLESSFLRGKQKEKQKLKLINKRSLCENQFKMEFNSLELSTHFFFFFEIGSQYVASEVALKLLVLLSQLPECWGKACATTPGFLHNLSCKAPNAETFETSWKLREAEYIACIVVHVTLTSFFPKVTLSPDRRLPSSLCHYIYYMLSPFLNLRLSRVILLLII